MVVVISLPCLTPFVPISSSANLLITFALPLITTTSRQWWGGCMANWGFGGNYNIYRIIGIYKARRYYHYPYRLDIFYISNVIITILVFNVRSTLGCCCAYNSGRSRFWDNNSKILSPGIFRIITILFTFYSS